MQTYPMLMSFIWLSDAVHIKLLYIRWLRYHKPSAWREAMQQLLTRSTKSHHHRYGRALALGTFR
jgi:hypothetical protein